MRLEVESGKDDEVPVVLSLQQGGTFVRLIARHGGVPGYCTLLTIFGDGRMELYRDKTRYERMGFKTDDLGQVMISP